MPTVLLSGDTRPYNVTAYEKVHAVRQHGQAFAHVPIFKRTQPRCAIQLTVGYCGYFCTSVQHTGPAINFDCA
jgi:hypothetical protein